MTQRRWLLTCLIHSIAPYYDSIFNTIDTSLNSTLNVQINIVVGFWCLCIFFFILSFLSLVKCETDMIISYHPPLFKPLKRFTSINWKVSFSVLSLSISRLISTEYKKVSIKTQKTKQLGCNYRKRFMSSLYSFQ